MLNVLGIDLSTKAIDLVYLSEDGYDAHWHRVPLEKGMEGVRHLRHCYAWRRELEDAGVYLAALEQPMMGQRNAIAALYQVRGALLASLPVDLPLFHVMPSEWKGAIGLPRNARTTDGNEQLAAWAVEHGGGSDWPTDAQAALAMAWTARELNASAIERELRRVRAA